MRGSPRGVQVSGIKCGWVGPSWDQAYCTITICLVDPCDCDMFDRFGISVKGAVTCDKLKFSVGPRKKHGWLLKLLWLNKAGIIDYRDIK